MNNLEDKINTKDIIMERACLIFYWMANRLMRHRRCLMHVGERKRDEALIITRAIACEERQSLFDDTFGLRQTTAFHPRFGGFHFVVSLARYAGVKFASLITHLLFLEKSPQRRHKDSRAGERSRVYEQRLTPLPLTVSLLLAAVV